MLDLTVNTRTEKPCWLMCSRNVSCDLTCELTWQRISLRNSSLEAAKQMIYCFCLNRHITTKPSYIRLSDCTVCWRCLGGIDTSAGLIQDGGGGHSRCSLYVSLRHYEWAARVCQLVTDWNDSTLKSLFTYCKQYTLSFVFSKVRRYKQCPVSQPGCSAEGHFSVAAVS